MVRNVLNVPALLSARPLDAEVKLRGLGEIPPGPAQFFLSRTDKGGMNSNPAICRTGRFSAARLSAKSDASRGALARMRFHFRGLWRTLKPIPLDRPLPRPTHDF